MAPVTSYSPRSLGHRFAWVCALFLLLSAPALETGSPRLYVVQYSLVSETRTPVGTASAGADYSPLSGTGTFARGATETTIDPTSDAVPPAPALSVGPIIAGCLHAPTRWDS